jgi:hypothetical protein
MELPSVNSAIDGIEEFAAAVQESIIQLTKFFDSLVQKECKDYPRVIYLSKSAHKNRTRKKNIKRLMKIMAKRLSEAEQAD